MALRAEELMTGEKLTGYNVIVRAASPDEEEAMREEVPTGSSMMTTFDPVAHRLELIVAPDPTSGWYSMGDHDSHSFAQVEVLERLHEFCALTSTRKSKHP